MSPTTINFRPSSGGMTSVVTLISSYACADWTNVEYANVGSGSRTFEVGVDDAYFEPPTVRSMPAKPRSMRSTWPPMLVVATTS